MFKSIYALIDPRTDRVRYIGATVDPGRRLQEHLRRRQGTHCSRWIQDLQAAGYQPLFWVLEVATSEAWEDIERRWIAEFRALGEPLTNITDGGEGATPGIPMPLETRAKISVSASRWQTGRKLSPSHRENLSRAYRKRYEDPEQHARVSTHLRTIASRGGSANKGKPKSPEHNRRVAEAKRRWWAERKRLAAVAVEGNHVNHDCMTGERNG